MPSNTIIYILYVCIFLLLYIIYVDKRCNCHTNIKSKLIFSVLFLLLIILILYVIINYDHAEIPIVLLLILLFIFALYVQDLNNNNCTCLTENLLFNPLFLTIKKLSFYIIIILVILIIILSLNEGKYNYEDVHIMNVDISKYINNTLKSIEKNLLQFLYYKIN